MNGTRSVASFHRELGLLIWDKCGMARTKEGLAQALKRLPELREEFWSNVRVPGSGDAFNQQLEQAGRVADFLEFGELLCRDAYARLSSSPNCSAARRRRGRNPVAGTSARNTRWKAKPSAMTNASPMSQPGNIRATSDRKSVV